MTQRGGPACSTESLHATTSRDDRPPGMSQAADRPQFLYLLGSAIAPSPWLVAALQVSGALQHRAGSPAVDLAATLLCCGN